MDSVSTDSYVKGCFGGNTTEKAFEGNVGKFVKFLVTVKMPENTDELIRQCVALRASKNFIKKYHKCKIVGFEETLTQVESRAEQPLGKRELVQVGTVLAKLSKQLVDFSGFSFDELSESEAANPLDEDDLAEQFVNDLENPELGTSTKVMIDRLKKGSSKLLTLLYSISCDPSWEKLLYDKGNKMLAEVDQIIWGSSLYNTYLDCGASECRAVELVTKKIDYIKDQMIYHNDVNDMSIKDVKDCCERLNQDKPNPVPPGLKIVPASAEGMNCLLHSVALSLFPDPDSWEYCNLVWDLRAKLVKAGLTRYNEPIEAGKDGVLKIIADHTEKILGIGCRVAIFELVRNNNDHKLVMASYTHTPEQCQSEQRLPIVVHLTHGCVENEAFIGDGHYDAILPD